MPKVRVKRHAVIQPQDPSYKIIPLTRGQNTLVTTADHPELNQFNWHAVFDDRNKKFYAKRHKTINRRSRIVEMASEILQCGPNEIPDHKNHDTLDNRRENLRKATHAQNLYNRKLQSSNTSGYIGVCWHKRNNKWIASIGYKLALIHLGYFTSAEEAARARDETAKKLHGEFAILNFP